MKEMHELFGYWQGSIVPVRDIRISPQDIGVLRGFGVFDVMRTENNKPFLFEKHWERFVRSAATLGLHIPITQEAYADILHTLIAKNGFRQSSIRTVLTGGPSSDAFLPEGQETFYVLVTPFHPLSQEYYEQGAKLITLDFARDFPHAKITQYVMAIQHAKRKQEEHALEILYVRDGKALEASTSNFAFFQGNTLITPKQDILLGITRDLTLQLAQEAGFLIEEREVLLEELLHADEVFLTATNKFIVPITMIDTHCISNGQPGKNTQKLMQKMSDFVREY